MGLVILGALLPRPLTAQTPAGTLDQLTIDIWPDFDQPAALVLMTAVLPAGTPLPATLTLPLPPNAQLNAVARISDDNVMVDDIDFTPTAENVTLTTPDSRFRIEYYLPYTATDLQRTLSFSWQSDLTVNALEFAIQEPLALDNMITDPAPASFIVRNDGLRYQTLATTSVPAGTPFTVTTTYTLTRNQLTITGLTATDDGASLIPPAPAPAPSATTVPFNWSAALALVGGLLVIGSLAWQYAQNQQQARLKKPRPQRPPAKQTKASQPAKATKFCHHCGQATQPQDRFCRNCGTPLKN